LLELNKVYNEDCIGENGMCLIEDKSIDMILCDLPYGTTKNKWDSIIPFNVLWDQYNRIIKDNGAIVLFGSQPFTSKLILSNEKLFRYDLIWDRGKGKDFLNANRKPLKSHEEICVFYKHLPTYNKQYWYSTPYIYNEKFGEKDTSLTINSSSGSQYNKHKLVTTQSKDGKRNPLSVLNFQYVAPREQMHPSQKPIKLCEWLINSYTNENDLVLDNCMGSFTTAVACKNLNRNYIGFELDSTYYDLGQQRLNNIQ